MPRGVGRVGFAPYPRLHPNLIYPVMDILILIGIVVLLIHLFIVASFYVIALVALLILRMLIRPNYRPYGRMW